MIPLIVMPHDWQVLDANVGLYSTRYAVQHSCMFLYPRFQALTQEGGGAWFGAQVESGALLGLATARLDGTGDARWMGSCTGPAKDVWSDLLRAAIRWGAAEGAAVCWAAVSVEDEEKQAWCAELGFRAAGPAATFDLDGRAVEAVRLEGETEA